VRALTAADPSDEVFPRDAWSVLSQHHQDAAHCSDDGNPQPFKIDGHDVWYAVAVDVNETYVWACFVD